MAGGGIAVGLAIGVVSPTATRVAAASESPADRPIATLAASALEALQHTAPEVPLDEADQARGRYIADRKMLAAAVVGATGGDAPEAIDLDATWARTGRRRMIVVLAALSQVGVPYSFGAAEPGSGFDCSGLTSWAWAQGWVTLDHSSYAQFDESRRRDHDHALPGDITGFANRGHVGIYLGIGELLVHSPNTGSHVQVSALHGRLAWFVYPAGDV